jgi:hypothetical protein
LVIKIPAFEMLEKVNSLMKPSFISSPGCRACDLSAAVFPSVGLAALTLCAGSEQGTASPLSAALTKTFIYILNLFSKFLIVLQTCDSSQQTALSIST